jgi:Flp pilus assembly protein TadD
MAKRPKPRPGSAVQPATQPTAATYALLAAALVLITIAVYAQVRSHEFVDLDDGGYVVTNVHVNTGLTLENVRWALTTGYAANWHPLTWTSHQIDVSLFGMNPGRHHLMNVAWHVLNTLMLFGLLRVMTGALWRSAFVAAVFAVHPAHVESVAWVSERKDVLSTFFWLAATWAYVDWVRRPAAWRYGLVVVLYALGLLAKPMLVTLPFTLLLLDFWPLHRSALPWARRVLEKVPLLAMAMASSVVTAIVQQGGGAIGAVEVVSIADRLANAVVAYGSYLKMLVWPVDLAIFYPYRMDLPVSSVIGSLIVLAVITVIAWRTRRSQPFVLVGWLWFLGTLVPVIGLVQIGMQALADRYTYVPYIGLLVATAWAGRALAKRAHVGSGFLRVVGAGVVGVLAFVAHGQAATWATSEAIWLRAAIATTGNARAHNSLGVIYGNRGETELAAAHFQEALRLRPDLTEARNVLPNLGLALMAQGKVPEAVPVLERARQVNPERADLAHQLGLAYFSLDRKDEAIASWRDAVRLNPRFEEAHFTMGMVLAGMGRTDDARRAFVEVLRINPSRSEAKQALALLGRK